MVCSNCAILSANAALIDSEVPFASNYWPELAWRHVKSESGSIVGAVRSQAS
jgi:hypothetical protein